MNLRYSSKLVRQLRNLDVAFALTRHITSAKVDQFLYEISTQPSLSPASKPMECAQQKYHEHVSLLNPDAPIFVPGAGDRTMPNDAMEVCASHVESFGVAAGSTVSAEKNVGVAPESSQPTIDPVHSENDQSGLSVPIGAEPGGDQARAQAPVVGKSYTVVKPFVSDDAAERRLSEGSQCRVITIDDEGDARVAVRVPCVVGGVSIAVWDLVGNWVHANRFGDYLKCDDVGA